MNHTKQHMEQETVNTVHQYLSGSLKPCIKILDCEYDTAATSTSIITLTQSTGDLTRCSVITIQ